MKRICLGFVLLLAPLYLTGYPQVGQDLKAAGQDTKNAATDGAHKTGHAVKTGAKKSTHAVKKGVHKTATKVSDKTQDTASHE